MASGDWATARDQFRSVWADTESADALDGLGRAMWWLNDPGGALELRGRAFALLRRDGRDAEATAVSIWLARQYRNLFRRAEMADGWLARARSLVTRLADDGSLRGWLALAESEIGPPDCHRPTGPSTPWRSAANTVIVTSRSSRSAAGAHAGQRRDGDAGLDGPARGHGRGHCGRGSRRAVRR